MTDIELQRMGYLYDYACSFPKLSLVADELEAFIGLLLSEVSGAIRDPWITARAKDPRSFENKIKRGTYVDGTNDIDKTKTVDDKVAARIIVYTNKDRDTVVDRIRANFQILEGEDTDKDRRGPLDSGKWGYSSHHFVVEDVKEDQRARCGANLREYFDNMGRAEIQVRTFAAHAWDEYEHDVRYKEDGRLDPLNKGQRRTVEHLFYEAALLRRSMDAHFAEIERVLGEGMSVGNDRPISSGNLEGGSPLDIQLLDAILKDRFPDSVSSSDAGLAFGVELCAKLGVGTDIVLRDVLDAGDSGEVRRLMDYPRPMTSVRYLDDELLALFGEEYIEKTKDCGTDPYRKRREDTLRLRHSALDRKYRIFTLEGELIPAEERNVALTAASAFRTLLAVASLENGELVTIPGVVAGAETDAPAASNEWLVGEVPAWITWNLNRKELTAAMSTLFDEVPSLGAAGTRVLRGGDRFLPTRK